MKAGVRRPVQQRTPLAFLLSPVYPLPPLPGPKPYIPLFAWIDGCLVHTGIKAGAERAQRAIIPKGTPLHVDAHEAQVPRHTCHIAELFHIAGIGAGSCRQAAAKGWGAAY